MAGDDEEALRARLARVDWPLRAHSRLVRRGGLGWHVQTLGEGPVALLLHGTGASTHSFRALGPLLAQRFKVVMFDLPGHGFTTTPATFEPTMPAVAAATEELLAALACAPALVVGHSAGAAIGARMVLDGCCAPELLVGLAAAMVPFRGPTRALFVPAAKALARSRLAATLLAFQAGNRGSVAAVLASTGSPLDPEGVRLYQQLAAQADHVGAVLQMMAAWDLDALWRELPGLRAPLRLLAGERDRAVPVAQQRQLARHVPGAHLTVLPGLGHLLHEEQPAVVAALITEALAPR